MATTSVSHSIPGTTTTTKVSLSFTLETYQQHYQHCLKKKAGGAKVEGFRVGKAPLAMIEARHRLALQQDALNETIQSTIDHYLIETKPLLVSPPKIVSALKTNADKSLHQFEFELELFPTIKLKSLAGETLLIPFTQVPESCLKILHQDFLHARASRYEISQEAAAPYDHVNFSMKLPFAEGETELQVKERYGMVVHRLLNRSHSAILPHSESLLGVFEPTLLSTLAQEVEELRSDELDLSQLIGLKSGESLTATLTIDGIKLPVIVTLHEVQKAVLSPLTHQELRKIGCSSEESEEFSNFLKEQTALQISVFRRYQLKKSLLELLKSTYAEIEIPKTFFLVALARLPLAFTLEDQQSLLSKPFEELSEHQKKLAALARQKALPDLLLSALSARYNIHISSSEVDRLIHQAELAMKQRGFALNLHKDAKKSYVQMMRQYVLEEKILHLLETHITCAEPEIDFAEFVAYAKSGKLPEHLTLSPKEKGAAEREAFEPSQKNEDPVKEKSSKSKKRDKKAAVSDQNLESVESVESVAEGKSSVRSKKASLAPKKERGAKKKVQTPTEAHCS